MGEDFQKRCGRGLTLNKTLYAYTKACGKGCVTVHVASQSLLLTKSLKFIETIQDDSKYLPHFFATL